MLSRSKPSTEDSVLKSEQRELNKEVRQELKDQVDQLLKELIISPETHGDLAKKMIRNPHVKWSNESKLTSLERVFWNIMKAFKVPFIVGPHGHAKTAIVKSIADKMELGYLDIRLSQKDPVDLGNFPLQEDRHSGFERIPVPKTTQYVERYETFKNSISDIEELAKTNVNIDIFNTFAPGKDVSRHSLSEVVHSLELIRDYFRDSNNHENPKYRKMYLVVEGLYGDLSNMDLMYPRRVIKSGYADWMTLANQAPCVIVFEELNRCSPDVQNAALQILNERCVGLFYFNNGVFMASTGNQGDADNNRVNEFDAALVNRLCIIEHKLDINQWMDDFASKNVHPLVRDYLNTHTQEFCTPLADSSVVNNQPHATPRSWTNLSDTYYANYTQVVVDENGENKLDANGNVMLMEQPLTQESINEMARWGGGFIGEVAIGKFTKWLSQVITWTPAKIMTDYHKERKQSKKFMSSQVALYIVMQFTDQTRPFDLNSRAWLNVDDETRRGYLKNLIDFFQDCLRPEQFAAVARGIFLNANNFQKSLIAQGAKAREELCSPAYIKKVTQLENAGRVTTLENDTQKMGRIFNREDLPLLVYKQPDNYSDLMWNLWKYCNEEWSETMYQIRNNYETSFKSKQTSQGSK